MTRFLAVTLLSGIALIACNFPSLDPNVDANDGEPPKCSTATEDVDCGTHEYCAIEGRCACVAGYTDSGTGCAFTATIADPGFASSTTWTVAGGALVNQTAGGEIDPGVVSFSSSALCDLAYVTQTVEMPTVRKAEPLALVLSYKNPPDRDDSETVLMGVSLGGGWFPLPNFPDTIFHTVRVCLPEGGFAPKPTTGRGAPVVFALGPYQPSSACPESNLDDFAIDHASIVVADPEECGAAPGLARNFDAEGTGGWTFTTTGNSSGGFSRGLGVDGTKAARITLAARCDTVKMETVFDVSDVANPALELFIGTTANANGTIDIGNGVVFTSTPPAGTTATLHMCLPPSLRGQAMPLRFEFASSTGACGAILNQQLFVDNVRVLDDAECATSDYFTNFGFEQGGIPFGAFGIVGAGSADAVVRTDATRARTGTRYLSLESNSRCSNSGFVMLPTVPPATGNAGPALTFYTDIDVNLEAATGVLANNKFQSFAEGGGYRKQTVCLDPRFVGRPQVVRVAHSGGGGVCDAVNYPQQTARIDDVEVTTDVSCPTQ